MFKFGRPTFPRAKQDQNFYQLSCIQSVAIGPSAIMIGKQLSDQYGANVAIGSICIGNMILWLIGLAIISMVYQERTNAIENIKGYIGQYGSLFFALILLFAFIDWFVIEINATIKNLDNLFQYSHLWRSEWVLRFGAALGILTSLLAIGGIRLLKRISSFGFPLVLLYCIYAIRSSEYSLSFSSEWGLSFTAIISSILLLLPGVINLPTFFRHSRSRPDSFLALTLMTFFITFFECTSIWMNISNEFDLISKTNIHSNFMHFIIPNSIFIILLSICGNLVNIYLASACYETFIPKFSGTKGHAIMGLVGTAVYTFIQISSPVQFIVNLLNCYITVLGIVLLIGVLSRIIIKHRPRKFERSINMTSWLIGCAVATSLIIHNSEEVVRGLLYSVGASVLFFLCVFFIEETIWSIQKIKAEHNSGRNMG
jgi:hypothetical protein